MTTITNKQGYKKTKLGWIPVDWELKELKDIVKKGRKISYGIVQTKEYVENGIPCIRVLDLTSQGINLENLIKTSKEISNSYKKTIVEEDDLVFALRGKIGQLGIITKNLAGVNLTRGVALLAVNSENDNIFVYQQLSSPRSKVILERKLSGSALKELSIGVVRKIQIPLPPLPEQKKIAQILSTWDDAIDKTKQLLTQKKRLKKGLLQQLLTGKVRFGEFVKEKGYKQTKLGEIPKDWEVVRLGEVSQFLDHKRKPIQKSDRKNMKGIYPYYGASGIIGYVNNFIFNEELILLGEDGANIITRNSPLAFKVKGKIWVNNHAHVIKPKTSVSIDFLTYYLEELDYKKYNTGTAQPKLNKAICLKINIVSPPLPEQKAIAQVLSQCDEGISKLHEQLLQLQQQKKGLMQQLLTGAVRVAV